jgi:hypothetical protein
VSDVSKPTANKDATAFMNAFISCHPLAYLYIQWCASVAACSRVTVRQCPQIYENAKELMQILILRLPII